MGTQDDKISNNRRRLSKALSAAPVVATLSSGEVLANHSAFQCLSNLRDVDGSFQNFYHEGQFPTGFDVHNHCIGDVCEVHHIRYQLRYYWYLHPTFRLQDGSGNPIALPTGLTLEEIVVDILTGDGTEYRDSSGNAPTYDFMVGSDSPHYMEVKNDSDEVCLRTPRKRGLFLWAGVASNNDTRFDVNGAFPEEKIGGHNQGISGTCLASVPHTSVHTRLISG